MIKKARRRRRRSTSSSSSSSEDGNWECGEGGRRFNVGKEFFGLVPLQAAAAVALAVAGENTGGIVVGQ